MPGRGVEMDVSVTPVIANGAPIVVLDADALERLQLIASTPEAMTKLVSSFLENGASIIRALIDSATTGDLDVIKRQSHTLKSNASSFGATELAELCGQLEAQTRAGDASGAADMVEKIADAFDRTSTAFA
jgi:HPt (histidine-containing phosphotransfer) domain-containing protein